MVIKKLRNTGYFGTYYKIYFEEVMPIDKINEILLPDKIEFERIFSLVPGFGYKMVIIGRKRN